MKATADQRQGIQAIAKKDPTSGMGTSEMKVAADLRTWMQVALMKVTQVM